MPARTTFALLASLTLAACSGAPSDDEMRGEAAVEIANSDANPDAAGDAESNSADASPSTAAPAGSWTPLGTGVTYRAIGPGPAVFVAYGGYTALQMYSEAWADELWTAGLRARGVGHVYAVKGPADAEYAGKEIANSALRAHMAGSIADGAPFILIAAHSSGAFVANEILGQWSAAGATATLGKVVYAALDGGGSGLDTAIVSQLRRIAFVSATDSSLASGNSENTSSDMVLGSEYARYGSWLRVTLSHSGCNDGAGWCLHDLLITHKPHDPTSFDLKDDYTDFVHRPPTVEWIGMLGAYLTGD